jgi:arsenate reductase
MAEAFLTKLAGDKFEAVSAGLEPGRLNPLAVEVMKEAGIDISQSKAKSVFDIYKRGELFAYVITVCDARAAQRCPIFPAVTTTLNWSFEDPASFTGTHEEKIAKTRKVRDGIREKVEAFIRGEGRETPALDFSFRQREKPGQKP